MAAPVKDTTFVVCLDGVHIMHAVGANVDEGWVDIVLGFSKETNSWVHHRLHGTVTLLTAEQYLEHGEVDND